VDSIVACATGGWFTGRTASGKLRTFDRAAAYFEAETTARPENAWTQYMLGLSAWKSGDLETAETALRRSAELDGMSVKARVNLSRVLNDGGAFEQALEAAESAIAIDEGSASGLFLKARSLYNLSRAAEAATAIEASLAVDPGNAYAHNLGGLIHLEADRTVDVEVFVARIDL